MSRLERLQREFLEVFFAREKGFLLTGGAALAGFHIGHRTTEDLDLVTFESRHLKAARMLKEVTREIGATIESLSLAPTYCRYLIRRRSEWTRLDLALKNSVEVDPRAICFGVVRVASPDEILAAKLAALLQQSRCPPAFRQPWDRQPTFRDLVDVWALDGSGYRTEDFWPRAVYKDPGWTPGQFSWVLGRIDTFLSEEVLLPEGRSVDALRQFLRALRHRMLRLAFRATRSVPRREYSINSEDSDHVFFPKNETMDSSRLDVGALVGDGPIDLCRGVSGDWKDADSRGRRQVPNGGHAWGGGVPKDAEVQPDRRSLEVSYPEEK